jgi:hypothetical protein
MGYDYDRTAAGPTASPGAEAKKLSGDLLGELTGQSLDAMNDAIGGRVMGTVGRVKQHLATLEDRLKGVMSQPGDKTGPALNDAHFVLAGQLDYLQSDVQDWADKLSEVAKALKARGTDYKKVVQLCVDHKTWLTPVATPKGTKTLGTPFKWEVGEVTRQGVTWLSFIAKTPKGTFRIAPADLYSPSKSAWVLDKGGMVGWEKQVDQVFKSPTEAAAALMSTIS